MNLPECTVRTDNIQNLPDAPNISADELKQTFDKSSKEIKNYINELLLPAIENLIEEKKESINENTTKLIEKSEERMKSFATDETENKILEDNKKKYPIGKIIISSEDTSPETYLGFGTWTKIEDRFLFASGELKAGEKGGSKTNTHQHYQTFSFDGNTAYMTTSPTRARLETSRHGGTMAPSKIGTFAKREDSTYEETIDIMPPYEVVHVWKRTE